MLGAQRGLALLALLAAIGCDHDVARYGVNAGQVGLELAQVDSRNLAVVVVNRSSSSVKLSGLFEIGYVQSPVTYEVKADASLSRKNPKTSSSIPVLVNLEAHRIELVPGQIHGAVFAKEDLAALLGLDIGSCYEVRALYEPPDETYTDGVMPSEFARLCF